MSDAPAEILRVLKPRQVRGLTTIAGIEAFLALVIRTTATGRFDSDLAKVVITGCRVLAQIKFQRQAGELGREIYDDAQRIMEDLTPEKKATMLYKLGKTLRDLGFNDDATAH